MLARVLRLDPAHGVAALPAALGYWPAAVSLGAFAWLELVFGSAARPVAVGVFLIVYPVVHVAATLAFGRGWFDRGDGFEAYSTLLGALSVFGRAGGRLVLRSPLAGLEAVRPAPGLVAVVVVLVGSTAYDGLARTQWWQLAVPARVAIRTQYPLLLSMVGLTVGAVGLVFAA